MSLVRKLLRREKKRRATVLAKHLERLGAAFCQQVGIDPREATLVSKTDDKTGETRYWYEQTKDRAAIDELHPDIKELFQYAFALDHDWDAAVRAGVDQKLKGLMAKYRADYEKDAAANKDATSVD